MEEKCKGKAHSVLHGELKCQLWKGHAGYHTARMEKEVARWSEKRRTVFHTQRILKA
jgi:hypothetical protein